MEKRVDELVELSKHFNQLTFKQKLEWIEEGASLLRKGRSMKEVLKLAGTARRTVQ